MGAAAVADTILLIHGDADVLRALGESFERLGYEVGRAATAEAGFVACELMRPDVVIVDLHLPDMGGLEVLERLRAQGGSAILLTEPDDAETGVRAMELGAEHFLTKPVDMSHLAAATARVVEKVRLARQNALLRARAEALDRLLADGRHQPLALAEVERVHIEKTLKHHGGNRTRSAQELGISRATLINKIKSYGLDV